MKTLGILRGRGKARGRKGKRRERGVSPMYPWWTVQLMCRYSHHIYRYIDPGVQHIEGEGEGEGKERGCHQSIHGERFS